MQNYNHIFSTIENITLPGHMLTKIFFSFTIFVEKIYTNSQTYFEINDHIKKTNTLILPNEHILSSGCVELHEV